MIGCRPLTDEEIDLLKTRADIDTRTRCLLILGATTGFRISELLSIKLQDVGSGRVYLHKRNTKGKDRSRSALLTPEAQEAIEALAYADKLQPQDYLFKSKRSSAALDRVQAHKLLTTAFKELGFTGKVATHSMRKYFAEKVYEGSEKDIALTAHLLGHRTLNSTLSYLSFRTERADEIVLNMRRTR